MSFLQKALSTVGIYYQPMLSANGGGPESSGGTTPSGEFVNSEAAMGYSAFYACARLLASTVGTLPLFLYETKRNGLREKAALHPLYSLLQESPNADQTRIDFVEYIMMSLIFDGNFYAKIIKGSRGIVALEAIPPHRVSVARLPSGKRGYRYNLGKGEIEATEDEIFHILGFGGGPLKGISTLSYARNSLGVALAADRAASSMFRNGLRPSGALETEAKFTSDQRVSMEEALAKKVGTSKSGAPLLLDRGMKWNQITMKAADAELLSSRSFSVEEVCRFMGVPPFMIGHTEKTTSWGTGIEQQMLGFQKFTLSAYLKRIEMAISKQLLPPQDRAKFHAEFALEGLLRGDTAARVRYYEGLTRSKAITPNEIRRKENLPPIEGGDTVWAQAQDVPIEEVIREALNE